jgi:hypothetical protein
MTEPAVVPPTPDSAATAPPVTPDPPKPTETVEFWREKARMQEDRAKANAAAAAELQQIKDRDLTELQRAQKDLEVERQRASMLERTSLQQQVALEKGIPADLVGSLSGATVEELTAHADRLLAWRGSPAVASVRQPQPDLSQGARPLDPAAASDAEFEQHRAQLFPNNRR